MAGRGTGTSLRGNCPRPRPAVAFFRVSGASPDAQDQGTLRLIRTETLKKATAGRGECEWLRLREVVLW